MAGNAMMFCHRAPRGESVTLRFEQRDDELAVVINGLGIEASVGLMAAEEEALMRFLIERCNARLKVIA